MSKNVLRSLLLLILFLAVASGGRVLAQLLEGVGGPITHIFTLTTSDAATYSNTSGALEPMPSTSLNVDVSNTSLLTISFSARGSVEPSGSQIIPIVFIACQVDGQACEPDSNPVEFLYPQFCCDTRSFNWVVTGVRPGTHTVQILWGMGNPTMAVVTNRSLIVEAAPSATPEAILAPRRPRE